MKTPQQSYPSLAAALGVPELYLKREDLHHFGSHKGPSIPLMIKNYHKDGRRDFVISSSGNAALAAILFIRDHNKNNTGDPIRLTIFVGENIESQKLSRLQSLITYHLSLITLHQVARPKQSAIQFSKEHSAVYLRQSTDDTALLGYHELAEELNHIPNLQAIFVPTSSGTTAQALGEAFETLSPAFAEASAGKQKPQIHIVQTEAVHPIAELCIKTGGANVSSPSSIASAIVDKVALRKEKVADVIKASGGYGWIVSDDEIRDAMRLVKETTGLDISPNSALSIAGVEKAIVEYTWNGPIVCLITGA